jgi:hypothetical protein
VLHWSQYLPTGSVAAALRRSARTGCATALKILRLDGETKIENSHVLAEYSAIIIDPRVHRLFRDAPVLGPGNYGARTSDTFVQAEDLRRMAGILEKKSHELVRFFDGGGVLVVFGVAPTRLTHESRRGYSDPSTVHVSTHDWFVRCLVDPGPMDGLSMSEKVMRFAIATAQIDEPFLVEGSGTQMSVLDPGHAFASYISGVSAYEARLTPSVAGWPNLTRLADNPAREVVAAELIVRSGLAILVPPLPEMPAARALFNAALDAVLSARLSVGGAWRLSAEKKLDEEFAQIQGRHREEVVKLSAARASVASAKTRVFESTQVKRVIVYWDRVTQEGASAPRIMQELYKLIEVLEDQYGGERALPDALGIDAARVKRAKRLANEEKYDLRHADSRTAIEPVRPPEVQEALEIGRELVQRFLDRRYADERAGAEN